MRTDCGMKRIRTTKSREPKFTCYKVSLLAAMFLESRLFWLWFTIRWSQEPDTSEILTRNSISLNSHLVKSCKPLGTENWFSLEDLPCQKSRKLTPFQQILSWISNPKPLSQMPVTPVCLCARPSVLTWVASPCPILVPTKVGSACAMVPCTISSEESDKGQLKITCHILTTLCTDQPSALKNRSSPMSHPSSCTFEMLHRPNCL